MLTALFSSRSITKPQFSLEQRYVRFHRGISCLCLHAWHILVVSRSLMIYSSFPKRTHLYSSICTKLERPQSLYTMRLRIRRLVRSLGVSPSWFFMTICRWERSPMTTALSASLPAMRWEALCRQSRCLLRLRSETRWYTFERWRYRRDFFLHLSRLERILSSCLLYQR